MGRGLSKLQRHILEQSARQERVYYDEILIGFFGFQPTRRRWPFDSNKTGHKTGQNFRVKDIGEAKYRCARASLSRACFRLDQRGLVRHIQGAFALWSGVMITDKGREYLSVTTRENFASSNR